jgi:hypothetical protein
MAAARTAADGAVSGGAAAARAAFKPFASRSKGPAGGFTFGAPAQPAMRETRMIPAKPAQKLLIMSSETSRYAPRAHVIFQRITDPVKIKKKKPEI